MTSKPDPWGLEKLLAASLTADRTRELHMLGELLASANELTPKELEAFTDMLEKLTDRFPTLTSGARDWVEGVCDRLGIDKTPVADRKPVPRGREVPLAAVLRDLPKRPPGRR